MKKLSVGARPIQAKILETHYNTHRLKNVSLEQYVQCWRSWLVNSKDKIITNLDSFVYGDFTNGTSQTFDHFVLRNCGQKSLAVFAGDFQYHACISKKQKFKTLTDVSQLTADSALIISHPFSDLGRPYPALDQILKRCDDLDIPVCMDLAYWGISKNINLDLAKHPCIKEVTSSLSKPFWTLENHRIGIRFSRQYLDDGISMLNEVNMQNRFSMSLALHYMNSFDCDWNWTTFGKQYQQICCKLELDPTDTIIFASSTHDKYNEFNRGIPGHNRICVSPFFKDTIYDS